MINVTQENISNGHKCSIEDCPIALAVKEVYPGKYISVTYHYIRLDNKQYRVTDEMKGNMYLFDKGDEIVPFSFELELL